MKVDELASAIDSLNSYHGPKVVLTMPKFKIEYNFGKVKDHMQQLGVNKIFNAGVGDFSNMFSEVSCYSDTHTPTQAHTHTRKTTPFARKVSQRVNFRNYHDDRRSDPVASFQVAVFQPVG